jgi:putative peptidoglycan lipid II flippase
MLTNIPVIRGIARAAAVSGGFSLVVKLASLGKEVLVAATFGVSLQLDAYLIALMLVGIPHGIVVNAIQWNLIPAIVSAETTKGHEDARTLLRQAVAWTLILLLGLLVVWICVITLFFDTLLASYGPEARRLVVRTMAMLCVYYFASGCLMLGYAVLQAKRKFAYNGVVPLATPLITAVAVALASENSAFVLAFGLIAGFLVELAIVQGLLVTRGFTLMPGRLMDGPIDAVFLKRSAKLALGVTAMSFLPFVEQAAAARLGAGTIATLGYANKLPNLVNSLSTVAVGVAVFPYFAELSVRGQMAALRSTLRTCAIVLIVAGALATILLVLSSEVIVHLFFLRGAFTEAAAGAVISAQQGYLVQLPGALVLAMATRLLLARNRTAEVIGLNVVQLCAFIGFVVVCTKLSASPTSIAVAYALAVSLAALVAYVLSAHSIRRALD